MVIALIIGLLQSAVPLEAASVSQSMLQRREARLQKRLNKTKKLRFAAASSQSSLSSSSLSSHPNKRRGGGGAPQHPTDTASAPIILTAPTITFADIIKNYGAAGFTLAPLSDSSGTFTFTSSDTAVATISGNTVTLGNAGATTITAVQAQSGNFQEKTVTATLTVNTIAPTIIALINIAKNAADAPFLLPDPTSNSAGAFSFTSTNAAVATVTGRTVLITGPGTTTIISTQAANGNYKSGSGVTTLTVSPGLEEA